MVESKENNPSIINHSNLQGGLQARDGKAMPPIGHNRRGLREINRNIIGAPQYVCAVNIRSTFERDDGFGKIPRISSHRLVTRKCAAEMATMQHYKVEVKKPIGSKANASEEIKDCRIIDVDPSAPMFVQQTEEMIEEIDPMDEEVEMEDVDQPVVDIDSGDQNNPLAVTEYVVDIYAYYKKVECTSCVPPNYMDKQPDINERMRAILIDWLIEVHYKFELMDETLYLTVNLIDRFLALKPVVRKKLQLVGVTAMLLASKYEEVSVPVVEDFVLITDKVYSREEVLEMERLMINSLQFNLSNPTLYVFMKRFLKAAEADEKLEFFSFFLLELCLIEYEMLRFRPSQLAAAAVFSAMCTLNGSEYWNKTCEWHTGYSQEQLMECSRLMVNFHQKAESGKLTGIHKKYNSARYGYAAKCEPARFLVDSNPVL